MKEKNSKNIAFAVFLTLLFVSACGRNPFIKKEDEKPQPTKLVIRASGTASWAGSASIDTLDPRHVALVAASIPVSQFQIEQDLNLFSHVELDKASNVSIQTPVLSGCDFKRRFSSIFVSSSRILIGAFETPGSSISCASQLASLSSVATTLKLENVPASFTDGLSGTIAVLQITIAP